MKFRKKPVVIEAIQTAGDKESIAALIRFFPQLRVYPAHFGIKTLEGAMESSTGDWLIKGIKGEFYFCKPDIFEETYEEDALARERLARALAKTSFGPNAAGSYLPMVDTLLRKMEEV
ncbi:hypothetical protein LCGC14_1116600 [marine sediment metagenome]|uniref:Uncharacterized protein n=1 Tax=marine sediment metagenome TaxID=412755 RepID=A0A0F9PN95_9ZZZZ